MARSSSIQPARRPAEIVREYIEAEFLHLGKYPEERLPTIHEFARHLGVSASTVRTVLRRLSDEGKLQAIPGRGTFLTKHGDSTKAEMNHCIGVTLAASTTEKQRGWGAAILLGITEEALHSGKMVTALDVTRLTDARRAFDRLDGVVTFPYATQEHNLERICSEQKKPVVHINPTYFHSTANFVSADFFKFTYTLARAWRETGRRRIAVAIGHPVHSSVSAAQIAAAFTLAYAGCTEARVEILEDSLPQPASSNPKAFYRDLGRHLIRRYREKYGKNDLDAVYGFGDWTAEGVAHEILAEGKSIPGDVSIVGGTGMDTVRVKGESLVTMRQPMHALGQAAVRMLLWRTQHDGFDVPGQYLMPELGGGNTLRPEERQAFQKILQSDQDLV